MDDILIDKIVYDANNWLESHETHSITIYPNYYSLSDRVTNEHINKDNMIFFKKNGNILFGMLLKDDRLIIYISPTNYCRNNVEITINFNDDNILMKWCGFGTERNRLYADDRTFRNVDEIYNTIESVILFEHFGPFERWSIDNYFSVIPKLTSLQFMLDKINKMSLDEQIIIEI